MSTRPGVDDGLVGPLAGLQRRVAELEAKTLRRLGAHDHNGAYPLGELGYAQVTANQGSITTETDLTGLTVTVTPAASRRIRVVASIRVGSSVVDDVVTLRVKQDGATIQTAELNIDSRTSSDINQSLERSVVITPTAASHTYKLTLARGTGSGSLTMVANTNSPAFILVEDIGPV